MKNKTQNKKQNLKDYKGITLIALVVTIIVLLILAAISITALMGEDGLITRADKAKIRSNHVKVYEAIKLEEQTYQIYARTNQIQTNLINYLQEKQIINEENIINVEKLLGGTLPTGNGTGTKDIYKLEKLTESGTNTTETYTVVYYDTNEVRAELGNLSDIVRAQDDKRTIDSIYQVSNGIVLWKNKKDQLFEKSGNWSQLEFVNITEDIEPIAENVKEVCYQYNLFAYYLTNDNKLYNALDKSLVTENVKEVYNFKDYCYYLTNDNKIYAIDYRGNNDLIATDVKDMKDCKGRFYLTNENKLYGYDGSNNILIAENVKNFGYELYLTNSNKLYAIDESSNILIAENVKEFYEASGNYLTNDNKLYNALDKSLVTENVKEVYNFDDYVYYLTNDNKLYNGRDNVLVTENMKELYYFEYYNNYSGYYLTTDNKLYDLYNNLVAENVKNVKGFYKDVYLTTDNKLYKVADNSLLAENVKEVYYAPDYSVFYLTNDNELYGCPSDYGRINNILIAENVEEFNNDYYRTSDGTEYIYITNMPAI